MDVFIYKLMYPITKRVFYVGQTTNLKRRLAGHLSQKQNSKLVAEIGLITSLGLRPIIKTIRKCPSEFRSKLERYFIAYYSVKTKYTLCNSCYGSFFYINNGMPNCRKSTSKDILRTLNKEGGE